MARDKLPIVVSIATIPSRIGHIRATLDSLLEGDLKPDQILVTHPEFCNWENSGYDIPAFLEDESYCRGIVKVALAARDWGPGTKLLGAIDHIPDECYLVLADDDVAYDRRFLHGLIEAQSENHDSSFSYYTYRAGGLKFGQGCDGYSFYTPNLAGVYKFAEQHVAETTLLYHDDLWIGFFLFKKGVKVRRLANPEDGELVYQQLLPNDVLSSKTSGELARDQIYHDHLERLIRDAELPKHRMVTLRARQLRDYTASKLSRIVQKFNRRIAESKT
jgi:hypothetical protein